MGKGYSKDIDYWAFGILVYEMLVGYTPFANDEQDTLKTIRCVIDGAKVNYPRYLPRKAKALVEALLRWPMAKRLGNLRRGAADVKDHPWFATNAVDWTKLRARETSPPWRPRVLDAGDASNFSAQEDEAPPMLPYHGDQSLFEGFDDPVASLEEQ